MENKTLKSIQVLSKIGKILSKIIYICCLVGSIGCIVGIVSLSVCGLDSLKVGGVTLHSIIEKSADTSLGTIYASVITGLILCCAECILAKMACKYFENELAAGTPFTPDGAKELLRLGICTICISVGSLIAADIAYNIINKLMDNVADMHLDSFGQVGTGIAFIIASLLCRYGAEKTEQPLCEEGSNEKE